MIIMILVVIFLSILIILLLFSYNNRSIKKVEKFLILYNIKYKKWYDMNKKELVITPLVDHFIFDYYGEFKHVEFNEIDLDEESFNKIKLIN
jgi:hypothetical protein